MKPIGAPDYVYRPWSAARKERARQASLARIAPPGFRKIYGVLVPEKFADEIRALAVRHRAFLGGPDDGRTQQFVRDLLAVRHL